MRLFQRLFYQPKHKEKTTGEQSIYRILVPSVLAIFLCTVCLCGASWAWFTASTSMGTTSIKTPEYKLIYQIGPDTEATELAADGTTYTLTEDACKITLKSTGTTGATGYCSVKIGEEIYYTEQIFADGTFTFTVNAAIGTTITLTPKWGSCAVRDNSNTITNNGKIVISSNSLPVQEGDQAENSTAVDTPTTPSSETEETTSPDQAKQTEEKTEKQSEETNQTSTEAATTEATEEADTSADTTDNITEQTE